MSSKEEVVVVAQHGHGHVPGQVQEGLRTGRDTRASENRARAYGPSAGFTLVQPLRLLCLLRLQVYRILITSSGSGLHH